ncbi:hypothetical protein PspLS_07037 [Pyricularia sp. CBS 133598]|nr:hypothetical protein PspLS_07037 [Pyricularia sp. CBS 133598]
MYFFRAITLSCLLLAALITAFPISVFVPRPRLSKRGDNLLYRGTSKEEGNSVISGHPVHPKGASHPRGYMYLGSDWETVRGHVLGRLGDKNDRTPFISTTPSRSLAEGFVTKSSVTYESDGALLMIDRDAISSQMYNTNQMFKEHGQQNPFGQQREIAIKGEIPSSAVRAVVFYNDGKKTTQKNPHYNP